MEATDRELLRQRYLRNRSWTRTLFDAVAPAAYESRPIALRNPICFYEGHIPAFAANTLLKGAMGQGPVDASLDALFERGIEICHETLRFWWNRFGPMFAADIRRQRH